MLWVAMMVVVAKMHWASGTFLQQEAKLLLLFSFAGSSFTESFGERIVIDFQSRYLWNEMTKR